MHQARLFSEPTALADKVAVETTAMGVQTKTPEVTSNQQTY